MHSKPRVVVPGEQAFLAALRASALAHVVRAGHVLQAEVALQALQYV
ncbi:hypothetical protein [Pseudomonas putida]|nr:hypothetical protein [Pseudomonas putida]